ncbi:uvrABC system protein A-like, partial [Ylistrum balloti]|uniref:uvrABC system protein A-like n=1 Tax=Ylistrum balloti TaxID=509963 RepID=UPI002905A65F
SGKSSLAFDTIFKEGQRRYLASLSAYARQFIQNVDRPEVDQVDGLSPTICIDQKSVGRNPRSTVGTITEIYDFLRLFFSRLGTPTCPNGHGPIKSQTAEMILKQLYQQKKSQTLLIMAPMVIDRKGEYRKELKEYAESGFVRILVDGKLRKLDEEILIQRYEKHTLEIILDRVSILPENHSRVAESIYKAVSLTSGKVSFLDYAALDDSESPRVTYSSKDYFITNIMNSCSTCGASIKEMEPKIFSFNSPKDACPKCLGLGYLEAFDPRLFVVRPSRAIFDGALAVLNPHGNVLYTKRGQKAITKLFSKYKTSLDTPWEKLPVKLQDRILVGKDKSDSIEFDCLTVIKKIHEKYNISNLKQFQTQDFCVTCEGSGLGEMARFVTFNGRNIHAYNQMQVKDLFKFFNEVDLSQFTEEVWKPILKEIQERLFFLINVGLDYLTIDRKANTLSGGEAQRIRLAAQVGSGLGGCLYVLDEPSIGLHSIDNQKLIHTLQQLKERQNSLIVIEHDEETMLEADYLVELGPLAGVRGGEITFSGKPESIYTQSKKNISSINYLIGEKNISIRKQTREPQAYLELNSINRFNLKNLDIKIPLGIMVALTGVSGSGKSTFFQILAETVNLGIKLGLNKIKTEKRHKVSHLLVKGLHQIDKVVEINQKPIGRTPRSNPATYTNAWTIIRDLFAQTREANMRGYPKGRFSFNVKGGRCEECMGSGVNKIETQIFSTIEVICEACDGKRFNHNTLSVYYKGKNIYDILEMNIEEAYDFFNGIPRLEKILGFLLEIGLGYMKLGQNSTTLSGGEAQRIKLAAELSLPSLNKTLYLLDEPTTGLHFEDIEKLLHAIQKLVDKNNTVLIIEHNSEIIKSADHIIEMGPKGGEEGGKIVFNGSLNQLSQSPTATGKFFKRYLDRQEKKEKGKTSIALDSIFSEGQRKYLESLSTYARRFLGRLEKPPVEKLDNLSPTIAIDQKKGGSGPRSTIATQTEIYDSLRVLFANIGIAHCQVCSKPLRRDSETMAAKKLIERFGKNHGNHSSQDHTTALILAPAHLANLQGDFIIKEIKDFPKVKKILSEKGFLRWYIDGKVYKAEEIGDHYKKFQEIFLVIDRLEINLENESQLIADFEKAYEIASQTAAVFIEDKELIWFTGYDSCWEHQNFIRETITPRHFSFNHHLGACENCEGIGKQMGLDESKLIPHPELPFIDALDKRVKHILKERLEKLKNYWDRRVTSTNSLNRLIEIPYHQLSEDEKAFLFFGKNYFNDFNILDQIEEKWRGLSFELLPQSYQRKKQFYQSFNHYSIDYHWVNSYTTCPICLGGRLKPYLLKIKVGDKRIDEILHQGIVESYDFFVNLHNVLNAYQLKISKAVIEEITFRLKQMLNLGIDYLSLDRSTDSLSGGEMQRIRISTQVGNQLRDVIYVLDEPTIGLHERDNQKLIKMLKSLRDLGNTVMLIEHDAQIIQSADHIVDIGPGAGEWGGSAGERQRLKIAYELAFDDPKNVLYLLDEPTRGLHFQDIEKLIVILEKLIFTGGSVVVIEHNIEFLRSMDHLIDLGPEGGSGGGKVVAEGDPRQISKKDFTKSYTLEYL